MHLLPGTGSIRARLWLGWLALAVMIGTLLIGNCFLGKEKSLGASNIGIDFIAFYRAGVLVHQGQARQLYDLEATRSFDRDLSKRAGIDLGDGYGPFYYPPFYAWLFVPLATMSFASAVTIWIVFGLVCFAASAFLLCRMIPGRGWRRWALAPAIMVVSLPFIQVVCHGQNTFVSLLLASLTVTAWRAGRGFWAGCAASLMLYKPQLAAVIVAVLVLNSGWRALAGAGLGAAVLVLVSILTLPGALGEYLHHLTPNVAATMAFHPFVWQRHVTLEAFWKVLLMGRSSRNDSAVAGMLAILCGLPLVFGLIYCIWRNRAAASPDRLIAATIATMPLLMPYYLDYDLLLLALPAVLFGSEMIDCRKVSRRDIWLVRNWVVLFLLLMVPSLTRYLSFSLVVPCLGGIAVLLMSRACQMRRFDALCDTFKRGGEEASLAEAA